RRRLDSQRGFSGFVGTSPQVKGILGIIELVAENDSTVLIQGESGTGKELVARLIHSSGPKRSKPFVPINCSAVVPDLLESELFGHVKGAFSGAIRDNLRLFRAAEGGTIFLDEIAEVPPAVQAKLLRTLQERSVRPVGGSREVSIDVRVIAATNRRLDEAIKKGDLRKDLFYRLNVISIMIPPLRKRREDIPLLIHHFLKKFACEFSSHEKKISSEAMDALLSYDYPGNVRELENAIERAYAIDKGRWIRLRDLPHEIQAARKTRTLRDPFSTLEETEKRMIREALNRAGGNRREATRMLGIGRSTLYRKLNRYGLA
ncbi:MAG: sigma-54-dependent Fis family transcriptional regulator, partial [Deltaproteobacteria bacterium]|nr:sigma-54-dependent Fis family transcriptional regulator [Deltaproteobacteria bacterium]